MARPRPTDKLDEIDRVVKAHPGGLSAPEIAAALTAPVPSRTLQSHLSRLGRDGVQPFGAPFHRMLGVQAIQHGSLGRPRPGQIAAGGLGQRGRRPANQTQPPPGGKIAVSPASRREHRYE